MSFKPGVYSITNPPTFFHHHYLYLVLYNTSNICARSLSPCPADELIVSLFSQDSHNTSAIKRKASMARKKQDSKAVPPGSEGAASRSSEKAKEENLQVARNQKETANDSTKKKKKTINTSLPGSRRQAIDLTADDSDTSAVVQNPMTPKTKKPAAKKTTAFGSTPRPVGRSFAFALSPEPLSEREGLRKTGTINMRGQEVPTFARPAKRARCEDGAESGTVSAIPAVHQYYMTPPEHHAQDGRNAGIAVGGSGPQHNFTTYEVPSRNRHAGQPCYELEANPLASANTSPSNLVLGNRPDVNTGNRSQTTTGTPTITRHNFPNNIPLHLPNTNPPNLAHQVGASRSDITNSHPEILTGIHPAEFVSHYPALSTSQNSTNVTAANPLEYRVAKLLTSKNNNPAEFDKHYATLSTSSNSTTITATNPLESRIAKLLTSTNINPAEIFNHHPALSTNSTSTNSTAANLLESRILKYFISKETSEKTSPLESCIVKYLNKKDIKPADLPNELNTATPLTQSISSLAETNTMAPTNQNTASQQQNNADTLTFTQKLNLARELGAALGVRTWYSYHLLMAFEWDGDRAVLAMLTDQEERERNARLGGADAGAGAGEEEEEEDEDEDEDEEGEDKMEA
jgi:hypothetical protein